MVEISNMGLIYSDFYHLTLPFLKIEVPVKVRKSRKQIMVSQFFKKRNEKRQKMRSRRTNIFVFCKKSSKIRRGYKGIRGKFPLFHVKRNQGLRSLLFAITATPPTPDDLAIESCIP